MSWMSRTWGTAANNRVTGVFSFLIALFVGAIVNYQLGGPAAGALVGLSIALLLAMVLLSTAMVADQVDSRLERMVGTSPAKFRIAVQDFPDYRFTSGGKNP
jgi:hypothetical protein